MLALALHLALAAQAPQPMPRGMRVQATITPAERAEVRAQLRGAWRVTPQELAQRRRALLSDIPREGVPVIDDALHEQLSDLQQRERVMRANPAILAWQQGKAPALKSLDFDQTFTLYTVLLLDLELDVVELMDCWTVETRTGVTDICDADGIFSRTVEEIPLKQRKLFRAVERRLRDAHLERLAADIEDAGYSCDESCADLKGTERKECYRYCRSDQQDAKAMAREDLKIAKGDLAGPIDRVQLLMTVMDYGMVFD